MKNKLSFATIIILFSIATFAQTNLTSYKGGDKELIRYIERNTMYPEVEFKEGNLTIIFSKIEFNKGGYIDSFKVSVNSDNPFGNAILLALNKSREYWQKNNNQLPIIIPFLFIDGDNKHGKVSVDYLYEILPQKAFFNLNALILTPIIFTRLHDKIY